MALAEQLLFRQRLRRAQACGAVSTYGGPATAASGTARSAVEARLCEVAGKTQQQVAALVEQRQDQTSEAERRKDTRLATLRRYVEVLGGELEIAAQLGRRRIRLRP